MCDPLRIFAPMRVLALFFSLYFLVLSCQACADEDVRSDAAEFRLAASHPGHGPAEPAGDWCSPLCQCHCCPGFTLPAVLPPLLIEPHETASLFAYAAALVPGVVAHMPASPWQPPQVAC